MRLIQEGSNNHVIQEWREPKAQVFLWIWCYQCSFVQAPKETRSINAHLLLMADDADVIRKFYGFLTLREAIVLQQVHHHFNEGAHDIYRYSVIMSCCTLTRQGVPQETIGRYMENQTEHLCNLVDIGNFCAALQNESMEPYFANNELPFMNMLVNKSKTDNAGAVKILLGDERCKVDACAFEEAMRRGYTEMAAVLQLDICVLKSIRMCHACSQKYGCYQCIGAEIWENSNECKDERYCQECVMRDNCFCEGFLPLLLWTRRIVHMWEML